MTRFLLALALTVLLAGAAVAQTGSCYCTTSCALGVCQTICTNCGGR